MASWTSTWASLSRSLPLACVLSLCACLIASFVRPFPTFPDVSSSPSPVLHLEAVLLDFEKEPRSSFCYGLSRRFRSEPDSRAAQCFISLSCLAATSGNQTKLLGSRESEYAFLRRNFGPIRLHGSFLWKSVVYQDFHCSKALLG